MTHKKQLVLFLAMAVLFLLSACSTPSGPSSTAQQVLQKSITAMKQLKSAHVDMKFNSAINFGTATSQSITINLTANGDEAKPDKSSNHLSLGQGMLNGYTLSEITLGRQVYIQNTKGQWYVLDANKFKSSGSNPFASANAANYNNLLTIAQRATYTDHGTQTLNGESLRHITVIFGKDALKDLLNATGQSSTLPAIQKQKIDTMLNNIKLENATLDVWIDEATSYVHHMELKFTLSMDLSSMTKPTSTTKLPASVRTSIDANSDYNKFNIPVNITAPGNAIPTDNPSTIFGFGGQS
ncbi:MAG: hypothetical protein NVSMB33_14780 [Ktedonobacteraceae bacterium]